MRRSSTWPALLASSVNLPHAQRLEVLREFVALSVLDGGPVVELLLLGRREVGKVSGTLSWTLRATCTGPADCRINDLDVVRGRACVIFGPVRTGYWTWRQIMTRKSPQMPSLRNVRAASATGQPD